MGLISAISGLQSTAFTIGKSTMGLPGMDRPISTMAANVLSPSLTGREMGDLAIDPTYLYDPSNQRIQGDYLLNKAATAPGALWRGTVKASLLFGTIPALAKTMQGASTSLNIMPIGLRTLMYGAKRGAGLWGFAAGTMMTGSPIGGLFTGGLFSGLARGTLLGKKIGAGGGGLLGILGQTKRGAAVEKWFKDIFRPDTFDPSITRTSTRNINDRWYRNAPRGTSSSTYLDQFGYGEDYFGDYKRYTYNKETTTGGRITTRRIKGFDWIQSDRVQEFDRKLNNILGTKRSKQFMTKAMSSEQLDEIIKDFGVKKGPMPIRRGVNTLGSPTLRGQAAASVAAEETLKRPILKDTYSIGKDRVYNVASLRKLGVAHAVAGNVRGRIMGQLTRRGTAGMIPGFSGFTFINDILNPETMTMMSSQVDVVNNKIAKLEKNIAKTQLGKGITGTTETISKTAPRDVINRKTFNTRAGKVKLGGFDKRIVKETVSDVADARQYRLSMGKMMGQAGLVHLSRYLRAMFIYGGVKKLGGAVLSNALNTVKTVTGITRSIGQMEFGTGKTLETRQASTERSRGIMAMQNVGISARSYLGQEASLMNQG